MNPTAARDRLKGKIRFLSPGEQSAVLDRFDEEVQKNPSRNPEDIASEEIIEAYKLLDD